jgi:amino acid adenylation domain-containing protein
MALHDLLEASVLKHGGRIAVIEGNSERTMDYERLGLLSDRLRNRLSSMGVQCGDRVGLYLRKSADGIASIFGILKIGAAYVPVDPTAPASRNAFIFNHCDVKAIIIEKRFEVPFREEIARLGALPPMIVLDTVGAGDSLCATLDILDNNSLAPAVNTVSPCPDDLAYILYTSGSTGKPKGVMLSHRNAVSFVNWSSAVFQPCLSDVFSSHAPFHFDLSIFDIYMPLKHGASLVLVPEEVGKEPLGLAKLICGRQITIWYSAPSILSLLAQFGKIQDQDFSKLRMVIFAGEVFPVGHLRSLRRQIPHPRFFNLYGPTETNVCTWYEIPDTIPDDRVDPYPIGKTCLNLESRVIDSNGKNVERGGEGELCIAGPNVMQGYWAMPEHTSKCFLPEDGSGKQWYKTGDIVVEETDGNYRYIGRRDRMVKKRGYRVELNEIETCLYGHASIGEAAVIALPDEEMGMKLKAHLSIRGSIRPSIIELKTFCSRHLPLYMIPDAFAFHDSLPRTSTEKVDYVFLRSLA